MLPLSYLNHLVYCPRRFWYMYVQGELAVNAPMLEGALLHERADRVGQEIDDRGRLVQRRVWVWSDRLQIRLAQIRAHDNPQQHHHFVQAFVVGKLHNMRTMILRTNRKREQPELAAAAQAMAQALQAARATTPDPHQPDPQHPQTNSVYGRLQGIEGNATAHYFQSFPHLLNDPTLFNGRSRRPPRDPVNALLSYGYTILLNQTLSAICTVGLDPYIGYLHSSQYGKPALALDLMEEFRPLIVDSVVLTLFNNNVLKAKDFVETYGAYRLTDHGRRTFLTKLESRFDETITHPTFGYKATYRRSLELQTRLLAKTIMSEIPAYPPFVTR